MFLTPFPAGNGVQFVAVPQLSIPDSLIVTFPKIRRSIAQLDCFGEVITVSILVNTEAFVVRSHLLNTYLCLRLFTWVSYAC